MGLLKEYLLSIIVAATLVSVVLKIIGPKSPHHFLIQTISGIFIVLTIVKPLSHIHFNDYFGVYDELAADADSEIRYGVESSNEAIRAVIKEQTEAYILEKAVSMGADLHAEITLDNSDQPFPISVKISGDVSPYIKTQLVKIISDDIGIPEEMQTWT